MVGVRVRGIIWGERSFAANSRKLARIRSDSRRIRANSPTVRQLFFSRTLANDWRTHGELSRTLAEFARIRAEFAANWRTVRQKSVFIKSFSSGFKYSANYCSPRTIRVRVKVRVMVEVRVWVRVMG